MTWAASAVAVGGLGVGASIYGASQAGAASKAAAQQAAQGQEQAAQGQIIQQQQAQQALAPYSAMGQAGMGELGYLMGLPGYTSPTQNPSMQKSNLPVNPSTGQPFTMNDFMASVNRMNPGRAGNVNDAQTLYSWYTSGQLPAAGINQIMGLPQGTVQAPGATAPGGAPGTATAASAGIAPGPGGAPGAPGGAGAPFGGLGSLMTPFTGANLAQTPGYQFQLQQGLEALQNKAAAGGTLASPNTQKDLMSFAEGLAGTRYDTAFQQDLQQKQQAFNQLFGVTQMGQQATGASVGAGQQAAQNIGSAQIGMANALAGGTLGQGAAAQGLYQNLAAVPGMMSGFYNKMGSVQQPGAGTWNPQFSTGGQPMYSGVDVGGGPAYG